MSDTFEPTSDIPGGGPSGRKPSAHGRTQAVTRPARSKMSAASKKASDISHDDAMVHLGIRIPRSLLNDLDARAGRSGMGRSDYLRALISLPIDLSLGREKSTEPDDTDVQVITDSALLEIRDELEKVAGLYGRCAKLLVEIKRKFASRSTLPAGVIAALCDTFNTLSKQNASIYRHIKSIESRLDGLERAPTVHLGPSGRPVNAPSPRIEIPPAIKNDRTIRTGPAAVADPVRAVEGRVPPLDSSDSGPVAPTFDDPWDGSVDDSLDGGGSVDADGFGEMDLDMIAALKTGEAERCQGDPWLRW